MNNPTHLELQVITDAEKRYADKIRSVTEDILKRETVKFIFIAGPSCSGKTTTTAKLLESLEKAGKHAAMLSIDDFYKEECNMPQKPDGAPDYEALESFDLPLLRKCLEHLSQGEAVTVPRYDFGVKKRILHDRDILPQKESYIIVEGLHALNPVIIGQKVPQGAVYRIFLDCHTATPSKIHYSRLMRRLVRDYHYRATDAERTFYLWDNVLIGEDKYIYPFCGLADICINTYFSYESRVFRTDILEIVGAVSTDSVHSEFAKTILDYISALSPLAEELVPKDSLLQEFIG